VARRMGRTQADTARELGISMRTVKRYWSSPEGATKPS
jgi:predicted transcriptional regulator